MSIKNKAVLGFSWTVVEGILSQGIILIIGIILARLLGPKDFGIIGIITAFVSISNAIIEGGFVSALIRKIDANSKDYSTVFYINITISIILYLILFVFSDYIGEYFSEPQLSLILKFSGLILIINAFSIIQKTILTKKLDFKTQAIIAILSSLISGIIAVIIAYKNFGVWSLVSLSILRPLINSILLWLNGQWRPKIEFSKKSFIELFDFGYKLLIANLINTIYKNIYYVLIGKYFSAISLGYYTRADQFQAPFSSNISIGIRRISFPIFSSFQNDKEKLKHVFIKFLKFSIFINFSIMACIAAISKPLILILIGEKWYTSIYYLQLLCIPGMFYPLQILNLNLLTVKGFSNLNLKLEIIKKIILIPIIVTSAFYNVETMLYGLICFSIIEFFINSFYTNKIIGYSIISQLKDIFPYLLTSIILFLSMLSINLLNISSIYVLISQLFIGFLVFIVLNELLKVKEYKEIKGKITTFLNKKFS
ncbi:lipopolysaccharide biosynthesis protein [Cellulophaga sp. L1A9]|uniref:lipopolysaccharide biosynthesis protein n=1 Tax=Cellulophaga sp. L1A9 TaxID=2686362 RepID=UPI00131C0569|nr:lipopolysaccharide biosynthesis protein [Cellulophaga sp. L1A9]